MMVKMFVPLHLTGLSVNGFNLEPDEDRLVSIPDDKCEEMKGHGLIDARDEGAISRYLEKVDAESSDSDEDEAPAPKKAKPAVKKTTTKKGKK